MLSPISSTMERNRCWKTETVMGSIGCGTNAPWLLVAPNWHSAGRPAQYALPI